MARSAALRFTYQDYLNLPEDRRYELIDGDLLMSPSPSEKHQRVIARLVFLLEGYLERTPVGRIYPAHFDVVLSDTDVVQPDVLFVSNERASIIGERAVRGAPDLVVEILSPATADRDRTVKTKLYARAGVRELWLVDADARTVEVLVNGENGLRRDSIWISGETVHSSLLPGFSLELSRLFA